MASIKIYIACTLPFIVQFTSNSESPIREFNDSDMVNFTLNFDDRMLITLFLATATNLPFTLQSTMQSNRVK